MSRYLVCALYKFVELNDYQSMREPLRQFMESHEIKGTLLLALEGINGTVSGTQASIDALIQRLNEDSRISPVSHKQSWHYEQPFYRTKVKLKNEIVTMGVEGIDPRKTAGTYVKPEDWNALISDPEVKLIDTRNDYEIEIGTFKHAVNPNTESFRAKSRKQDHVGTGARDVMVQKRMDKAEAQRARARANKNERK